MVLGIISFLWVNQPKKDKQQIIGVIGLFSDITLHAVRTVDCLAQMKDDKQIEAFLSLMYLLERNKTIIEIMEE